MPTTVAPGTVTVSTVIDEDQREDLLKLAREGDRSLSAEVRRAVAAHLRSTTDHEDTTHAPH